MNNIFTKLRDFVGLNEPAEYEYEYEDVDGEAYQNLYQQEQQPVQQIPVAAPTVEEERPNRRQRVRERKVVGTAAGIGASNMNNVIGMPGVNGLSDVAVIETRSFE